MNKHIPKALVPEVVTHQVFLTCAHSHDGNLRGTTGQLLCDTVAALCIAAQQVVFNDCIIPRFVAVVSAAGSYQQGPRSQAYHIFCSLVWIVITQMWKSGEKRATLLHQCIIVNANRRTVNGVGQGTRLGVAFVSAKHLICSLDVATPAAVSVLPCPLWYAKTGG